MGAVCCPSTYFAITAFEHPALTCVAAPNSKLRPAVLAAWTAKALCYSKLLTGYIKNE